MPGPQEETTVLRVMNHLGVSEYQIASALDISRNTINSKLHGTGKLSDAERNAITKAIKVPQRVLRMSPLDALQFLLDRERGKQ